MSHLSINLSIGKACFSSCKGCYNHWGDGKLLDHEPILDFLHFIKSNTDIRCITLCGGDPLSRPNILEVMRLIKKLGFMIKLDTVGTPLNGEESDTIFYGKHKVLPISVKDIKKLVDIIGIPIDGVTSEQANLFRGGRPRIIEETLSILNKLSQEKANICINTVVHKGNHDKLDNIFDLLEDIKTISKWQFFQFQSSGPLSFKNKDKFEISDKLFEIFCKKMLLISSEKQYYFHKNIEFKSVKRRKNNYLLIDTSGLAWMPYYEDGRKRLIIGNITIKNDYNKILETIKYNPTIS